MPAETSLHEEQFDFHRKALAINLDKRVYGTFAEIGAGQEVARNFFRVGGAAGTVAKTMSAYDMTFSDKIYGKASRYVARDRLLSMLDHEYSLLIERLQETRGEGTLFFAFANTVAARSFRGGGECHGWIGVRFQSEPRGEPNDIVLHVRMLDKTNQQQQEALGILGVNLIFGAFRHQDSQEVFIQSLLDDIGSERMEVDMIEFHGPAFREVNNRVMCLRLVQYGLTHAILIDREGVVRQPAEVLYKRPVLIQRGTFRPITQVNTDMFTCAKKHFQKCLAAESKPILPLLEMTVNNLLFTKHFDEQEFLNLTDTLSAVGYDVLISNYPEYYRLISYVRRYTSEPLASVLGVNSLIHIFNETYYQHLPGGILEAFGRLFRSEVTLFVYPMAKSSYDIFLSAANTGGEEIDTPEAPLVSAENIQVAKGVKYLYQHLLANKFIRTVEGYHEEYTKVFSTDLLAMMKKGDSSWKKFIPSPAAAIIEQRKLFGLTAQKE